MGRDNLPHQIPAVQFIRQMPDPIGFSQTEGKGISLPHSASLDHIAVRPLATKHSRGIPQHLSENTHTLDQLFANAGNLPLMFARLIAVRIKETLHESILFLKRKRIHPRRNLLPIGILAKVLLEPVAKHLTAKLDFHPSTAAFHIVTCSQLSNDFSQFIFLIQRITEDDLSPHLTLRSARTLGIPKPAISQPAAYEIEKVLIHFGHRLLMRITRIMRTFHRQVFCFEGDTPELTLHFFCRGPLLFIAHQPDIPPFAIRKLGIITLHFGTVNRMVRRTLQTIMVAFQDDGLALL